MRTHNIFNKIKMKVWPRGPAYSGASANVFDRRPDKVILSLTNSRSEVAPAYNKIAVLASQIGLTHAKTNSDGLFVGKLDTPLNRILNIQANKDQTGKDLIKDIVISMFDEGVVAIVPIEWEEENGVKTILSVRTAQIVSWYPDHVTCRVYNDIKGIHEDVMIAKKEVAIVENPFYQIMNEYNALLKKLVMTSNQADIISKRNFAGKLDLIIQYLVPIKNERKKEEALKRLDLIQNQLENSERGIAYIDGNEKITQLNRPVSNSLFEQEAYLRTQMFNQLGFTESIMNGTASETALINFENNIIAPVLESIAGAMTMKFLSKTQIEDGERILFIRNPFRLIPTAQLAELLDKLSRNAITSSNEARSFIGLSPSTQPIADELSNKNISNELVSNQNQNKSPIDKGGEDE